MEVFPFRLSKVGRGQEMDIPGEGVMLPRVKKAAATKTKRAIFGPSNPTEGAPREKVSVDNVEAPGRAKSLRGRIL